MSDPQDQRDATIAELLEAAREELRSSGQADTTVRRAKDLQLSDEVVDLLATAKELDNAVDDWTGGADHGETNVGADATLPPQAAEPILPAGQTLGRYVVEGPLGAGGMGCVYRALDPQLNRSVAVKVPRFDLSTAPQAELRQRFIREARAAAVVRHPHVCPIYDVGEHEGVPFAVMALIEGPNLGDLLSAGPLEVSRALELFGKIAAGLEAVHGRKIVHRDLKPRNVLIDAQGEPYLTDFGLSRPEDDAEHITHTGTLVGTPAYMAPEQVEGKGPLIGPRTDIYSLGVLLYRMLTGRLPFEGAPLTVMHKITQESAPPPSVLRPGLNAAFDHVIAKAMARDPAQRYPSVREFADAITAQQRPAQRPASRWRILSAAAVLLAVLGTLTFFFAPAILRIPTNKGELIVEVDAQDVEVSVKQGGAVVIDRKKDRSFVLTATGGEVEFYDPDTGVRLLTKEFKLQRGGTTVVRAREELAAARKPRDTGPLEPGTNPVSPLALVTQPAPLSGAVSWTVETRGHRGHIHAVGWNQEGSRFATAAEDGSLRIWDVASGKLLRVCLHSSALSALAWSPDGKRLAMGTWDQDLTMWDMDSGQARTLPKHGVPRKIAWSPDGRRLVVGTAENRINLYDPSSAKLLDGLSGHTGSIAGLAWSPDGKTLASAAADKTLRLWNTESNTLRRTIADACEGEAPLAWSPNSDIISCGKGQTIRSWVAETAKPLPDVKTPSPVTALAFLPDSKHVVSGCADGTSQMWNLEDGKLARAYEKSPGNRVSAMAWSPKADALVTCSASGAIWVWEPKPGRLAHAISGHRMYSDTWNSTVVPLAWSPKGNFLAVNQQDGRVDVWDLSAGKYRTFLGAAPPGTSLAWSPDGASLASGAGDSVIRLWSMEKNTPIGDTHGVGGWIYALAWLPDGKSLFAGSQANDIAVWGIQEAKPTWPLKEHKIAVSTLAVSREGSTLISGDHHGKICIWDLKSRKPVHVLKHGGFVRSLVLAPEGNFFASSAGGDGIKIWEMATGKLRETIQDEGHADCIGLGLSPDAKMLAYGSLSDRKVRVWSLDQNVRKRTLEPSLPNRIMTVAWSPDGTTIAASTEFDSRIYLWDAASGKLAATLFALSGPHGFIVSPQGHVNAGPEAAAELIYVVLNERGQDTLSSEEFATKYRWQNNPSQIKQDGG